MASTNLGKLDNLPAEVRAEVWENLRSQDDNKKTSMNILSTCRQLYHEVFHHIYPKEILTFKLSPIYDQKSWISVTSSFGTTMLESSSHAKSIGFKDLPYHHLKGIEIQIEAPDPRDPGQLFNLWAKARSLVDLLLGERGRLPEVAIHLLATSPNSWFSNGDLQSSISHPLGDYIDAGVILLELCRIRNCKAEIHLPPALKGNATLDKFLDFFRFVIGLDKPFGAFLHREGDGTWADDATAECLDSNFIELHNALDELRGPTAAMMRLERFRDWYDDNRLGGTSSYLDELERILKTSVGEEEEGVIDDKVARIKWRHRLMVAFNPLSAKMQQFNAKREELFGCTINGAQIMRCFEGWSGLSMWTQKQWERYWLAGQYRRRGWEYENYKKLDRAEQKKIRQNEEKVKAATLGHGVPTQPGEDGWDREEWFKFYPGGIPLLSAALFKFELSMGHLWSEDLSLEPRERFKDWEYAKLSWEQELRYRMMVETKKYEAIKRSYASSLDHFRSLYESLS
jgi:hypothetical protein